MKIITIFFLMFTFGQLAAQEYDRVFVFLNKNPDKVVLPKEEEKALIDEHLANMEVMAAEGKLINAGPFEGGGGIYVMNTASIDTVNTWVQSDPAIRANRWILEVFPFTTTVGGSCIPVPPYEMVTYQFIRYTPSNEIANYKSNEGSLSETSMKELSMQLKQTDELLMQGHFANNEGGVLVVKDSIALEAIKSSAVQHSGSLSFEYKELWIAKGSFCEN